jgi:hypothetical protein
VPNSCPIRRRTPVNQSQPQLTFRRTQGKPPWSQDPPDTSSKLVIRQTLLGRSTSQLRETGHGGGLVSVFVSVAFVRLRSPTLRSDPVMRAGREHARTTGKPGWKACWTDSNRDSNVAEKGPVGGEPVGTARLQRIVMDCGTGPARTYGSVSVVAVLLGGGPPGSVSVTRCDSLRIRPLRRALHLTCLSWLPAPAWPTSWPD